MTSQRVPENYKPCVAYNGRRSLHYLVLSLVFGNGYAIKLSPVFKHFSVKKYVMKRACQNKC